MKLDGDNWEKTSKVLARLRAKAGDAAEEQVAGQPKPEIFPEAPAPGMMPKGDSEYHETTLDGEPPRSSQSG